MKFPNALEGVKKIYKAEIIALIGVLLGVVAGIIALFAVAAGSAGSAGGAAAGAVGAGALGIAMAVLMVIAFIMNIVGINKAKLDEENFKYALYCVIVGIVASIVLGATKEGSFLNALGSTASKICSMLTTWYVCNAIVNLAEKLEDKVTGEKGVRVRKLIMVVWVLGIVLNLIGDILERTSGALAVVAVVLSLAAAVLEIVVYILYLKLLSKATKMLEA